MQVTEIADSVVHRSGIGGRCPNTRVRRWASGPGQPGPSLAARPPPGGRAVFLLSSALYGRKRWPATQEVGSLFGNHDDRCVDVAADEIRHDRRVDHPKVVNAAGAWADRIAAAVGEPVPLEVIAPMLMITGHVPAFIEPVVILRSRKL